MRSRAWPPEATSSSGSAAARSRSCGPTASWRPAARARSWARTDGSRSPCAREALPRGYASAVARRCGSVAGRRRRRLRRRGGGGARRGRRRARGGGGRVRRRLGFLLGRRARAFLRFHRLLPGLGRIVGDVPALALENERRPGEQALERASESLTDGQRGLGDALPNLELASAVGALVFVCGHK